MAEWVLKTPVAFVIFNRPEKTARVFAEIAKAKPPKLLVVADGPRKNRDDEARRCESARRVIDQVDWKCDVLTNYSDVNLGCRRRVSTGIDWVFQNVEEAIFLEDDCLPHPTFFRFCEELLEKYRDDERIAQISGVNFQFGRNRTGASYYFSRYNHIWGWASWRRAWRHYDVAMRLWPEIRDGGWFKNFFAKGNVARYWESAFESTFDGRIDTWDYQWTFACWLQHALTVLPTVNLISNIGFGAEATHTFGESPVANVPLESTGFPLRHPEFVLRDHVADEFTELLQFTTLPLWRRAARKIRRIVFRRSNRPSFRWGRMV